MGSEYPETSGMYCYLLEFVVKQGEEDRFVSAWEKLTDHIQRVRGGLGSRLHQTPEGKFLAYAQWPNKEARNRDPEWSKEGERLHAAMRETLEGGSVRVLYEMKVVKDLLK